MSEFFAIVLCLFIGVWIGFEIGHTEGKNGVLREQCEAVGRTWAMVEGEYQCLDVRGGVE